MYICPNCGHTDDTEQDCMNCKRGGLQSVLTKEMVEEKDRSTLIFEAVQDILNADSPKLLTQSGKPRVDAVEKMLGFDITTVERDAAI